MILMKTLLKVLVLGLLLTAFSALAFAQDNGPDLATLFEKFKTEAKAKCGERDAALVTGKEIVDKFGADELNKDVIEFVKKKMADIEKTDPRCKLETRYDTTYKAKNWPEFLNVSKQILAMEGDTPLGLDILLTQVSVGYDRGATDADSISNAKLVLQRVDAGKASKTGNWGVFEGFKTKDFPQGKDNVQGWMNYIIGTTMYNKLNQKKEALPYLYKVTQINNEKKNETWLYTSIGQYYFEDAAKIFEKYTEMRKANNNEDTDETRAILGLARGTADRAADAFGRAYKIAADAATKDPAKAQLKTTIAKTLTDLYKFRFNLADAKQADVDKYVSELTAKPMPDPATDVTPVVVEKPATSTTSTTSTTPATPTTNTKATTTTPVKQPMSSTATTSTTDTTTATTTKPATTVKKPAPKKKGTR
jgi:hypothetical protein